MSDIRIGKTEFAAYKVTAEPRGLRIDYLAEAGDARFVFLGGGNAQSYTVPVFALEEIVKRLNEIRAHNATLSVLDEMANEGHVK